MIVKVIKLKNNPTENTEGSLYWSNLDGWGELDDATTFGKNDTCNLPIDGEWVLRTRQWSKEKKDEIEIILIEMWATIGMGIPANYEDIVQDCYEDVSETADVENWNCVDVRIAFRRWIENK